MGKLLSRICKLHRRAHSALLPDVYTSVGCCLFIVKVFPTTYQLNKPKSSHAFATKINLPFWELGLPKMYVYDKRKHPKTKPRKHRFAPRSIGAMRISKRRFH